eukprot:TRINITY_DN2729_c0_g1_i1.p1 TRINITY_DN2729_c0_g1~~TRINITY_DN2729_c0_g1_i1.p1  ORF type:complete len:552 (-),score=109.70 TRINITY_DN2729_c0_g1_i1:113-1768(-)
MKEKLLCLLFFVSFAFGQRAPSFTLNITDLSTPLNSGTYGLNSLILLEAVYNGKVDVSNPSEVTLRLNIWRDNVKKWAEASYLSAGSASNSLLFGYVVQRGDYSPEPLDAYRYDAIMGGTIEPEVGLCQTNSSGFLQCPALSTFLPPRDFTSLSKKTIFVYAVPPAIQEVSTLNAPNYYGIGQTVRIQIRFSAPVVVVRQRTPFNLVLNSDISFNLPIPASAKYVSGSGTSVLNFEYQILKGQYAFALNYNYFASLTDIVIRDATGANEADLTLPAPNVNQFGKAGLVADGIPPYPLVVSSSIAPGTVLVPGSRATVFVYFNEPINLENFGRIQLVLNIGAVTLTDFSNNQILSFTFTINATTQETNQLNYVGAYSLIPNGARVVDRAGNEGIFYLPPSNQELNLPSGVTYSPLGQQNIQVSRVGPRFLAVTASVRGAVVIGTSFQITVLLTQAVNVTNALPTNPALRLNDGGLALFTRVQSTPVSGLVFTYNVPANSTFFNSFLDIRGFEWNSDVTPIRSVGQVMLTPTGIDFNNPNLSIFAGIFFIRGT